MLDKDTTDNVVFVTDVMTLLVDQNDVEDVSAAA